MRVCVVMQSRLSEMSEMVWWCTTETVENPLVDLGWTEITWTAERNREELREKERI